MHDRLYAAVQSLLDRGGEITREEIDDVAVWATQVFGVEMLPRLRDRDGVDALELVRTMCLDASSIDANYEGVGLVASLIGSERAQQALRFRFTSCKLSNTTFRKLAAMRLERLRVLELVECRLRPEQLAALCKAEGLGGIECLDLTANVLREEGAKILGTATAFPKLRALKLRYTRMQVPEIVALGQTPAMRGVRTLELGTDKLGPTLGERFASDAVFPSLRRLSIYKAQLGNKGAIALAARPGLRALRVMENGLGNAGVAAIATSPAMGELEELRCRYDKIGDDALAAIASSPHMARLKRLQLSQCMIGRNGVKALAQSPHVRLESLNLGTNRNIGVDGVTYLAACSELRELVLDGTQLGDAGADYLATVTTWPKLERLSLQHDQLTDRAIDALLAWPQLRRLRVLELGTNGITDAGLARLVNAEGLRLERLELWQTPCAANAHEIVKASPLQGITVETSMTARDYPAWVD